jgi:hypothetical protein
MTKNLHEPSNETEIARQGYRIRQLERRPASTGGAAGGATCLPYAIISFAQFPGETVASDTETLFGTLPDFGDEYESDSAVFDTDGVNGKINIFERGLYLAEASIQWDGDISGIKLVRVEWSGTEFTGEALTTVSEISIDEDETTQRSLVFVTGEPVASVTATFEQRSGSPQDVIRASLKVIRLAEYPAEGGCSGSGTPFVKMVRDTNAAITTAIVTNPFLDDGGTTFDDSGNDDIFKIVAATTPARFIVEIYRPGIFISRLGGAFSSLSSGIIRGNIESAVVQDSEPGNNVYTYAVADATSSFTGLTDEIIVTQEMLTLAESSNLNWIQPRVQHNFGSSRNWQGTFNTIYLPLPEVTPSS